MNLIITNPSNKELADILNIHFQNKYPELSKKSQEALIKLVYFYDCSKIVHTSNQELQKLFSCRKRRVQQITQELTQYGIIQKNQESSNNDISCDNENSLHITINLPSISGIKFKQTKFLATYVKTETMYVNGTAFKTALFEDIHDIDNVITLKTDRISYDDETSHFLKKLKPGDIINYTPSIHKPTFKGIKYPLNLRIHSRTETEGYMTLFGTLDSIQEIPHEQLGFSRCAWFTNVATVDFSVKNQVVCVLLQEDCCNSQTLDEIHEGQLIVFNARIHHLDTRGGRDLITIQDVSNIRTRDEYYDNYGARA